MIRPNKLKVKIAAGERACGFMLPFACAQIVEVMGNVGFDFVILDAEHGPLTPESVEDMCRAADAVGLSALVRVPDSEPSTILRYMDRGPAGIQVPHVNSRLQAEDLVRAVKYFPHGKRGLGTHRASTYDVLMSRTQYAEFSNSETMIIVQLEELEALNNLDEILEVNSVDLFDFGANDLSQSMGIPGDATNPRVVAAIHQASDKIRAAGRLVANDVMSTIGITNLLIGASRDFLLDARG
jgi:2-keto-3-deoxy-L-rhamnonate aldolase RhmA